MIAVGYLDYSLLVLLFETVTTLFQNVLSKSDITGEPGFHEWLGHCTLNLRNVETYMPMISV